jgi:hypothetical protein
MGTKNARTTTAKIILLEFCSNEVWQVMVWCEKTGFQRGEPDAMLLKNSKSGSSSGLEP